MDSLSGAMVSLLELIYLQRIKGLLKETLGFLTENNIPLEKNVMFSMEVSRFHMEINWILKRINVFLEEIIVSISQGSPWIPSGGDVFFNWGNAFLTSRQSLDASRKSIDSFFSIKPMVSARKSMAS